MKRDLEFITLVEQRKIQQDLAKILGGKPEDYPSPWEQQGISQEEYIANHAALYDRAMAIRQQAQERQQALTLVAAPGQNAWQNMLAEKVPGKYGKPVERNSPAARRALAEKESGETPLQGGVTCGKVVVGQVTKREDRMTQTTFAAPALNAPRAVYDGTYTVVSPSGEYRTLKVRTKAENSSFAPGEQVISLLVGPDNEGDFQGFGFVKPDGSLISWKRFRGTDTEKIGKALLALLVLRENSTLAKNGYTVKESLCCRRCGRKLTVPASLYAGFGPECRQKVGL